MFPLRGASLPPTAADPAKMPTTLAPRDRLHVRTAPEKASGAKSARIQRPAAPDSDQTEYEAQTMATAAALKRGSRNDRVKEFVFLWEGKDRSGKQIKGE